MCGIAGYITRNTLSDNKIIENMTRSLHYRGPDDEGTAIYDVGEKVVAFGQSRLSIIDLSKDGHQPMEYNHLSIVFNGEIYNYQEIKKELEQLSHEFVSSSDTEVILHAFDEWGNDAVNKFIGMFAFSIFDKRKNEIYLFRDRVGVKPLYYYFDNDSFLFSSEIKSLHKHPVFKKEINKNALISYFDYGYIPAPNSIFKNCFKLEPGKFLTYSVEGAEFSTQQYWNVEDYYRQPKVKIDYQEAKDEVHKILKSAYAYRMVADVPVGVFLSAGYDSTSVAAILQDQIKENLKTFTIGFKEGNNEAPYAKEIAHFLGTDHQEYYFSTTEAQEIIPDLPYYYDEPFFDSSAIPTIMVSRLAREKVTVALSADGGDEIFAGYNSYRNIKKNSNRLNKLPNVLKPALASIFSIGANALPQRNIEKIHKLKSVSKSLNSDKIEQARRLIQFSKTLPEEYRNNIFNSEIENTNNNEFVLSNSAFENEIEMAMALDYKTYLPDDILTKVDRATMSVSLEGREPLLDHRIIEFVATLPLEYKYDRKITKRILKDIVHDYIPKQMMDRPKTGFSIPIYTWLKNDLSYLLDEYLNKTSLQESGLFNEEYILDLVERFKQNKLYYVTIIWKLLMFQMWYFKWCK